MTIKQNKINPLRILHITRIAKGGVVVVLDQLARGLDSSQYELVVLFDTPQASEIRKKLVSSSVKTVELVEARDILSEKMASPSLSKTKRRPIVERYFGKRGHQLYLSLKSIYKFVLHELPKVRIFKEIIKEYKIVVVHTHSDLRRAKPEIVAAKLAGIPCVTHRHGYSTYNWFDRLFAGLVAKNIYISSDVANYHATRGEKQSKGVIIHNAINLADYEQKYDTLEVRKEFECSPDQPLIGLVARLDWWKGHEFFIEALAKVRQQHSNVKGLIIGGIAELNYDISQRYLDTLHEMTRALELQDIITFTGHRKDIPRLLSALDVVVHASSTPEPFGLTVIEGMAMGKPVVATAAGGVLDIIEDGVSGLLVPRKDSKAMAAAILQLLSEKNIARRVGFAARKRVEELFTLDRQCSAIQKLYGTVLKGEEHDGR